jgi:cyclic lactone autoinducer peptide
MTQRVRCDKFAVMRGRIANLICLLLLAATLGGCTKCGWIWDQGPRACHSDAAK